MTQDFNGEIIAAVVALYKSDAGARALFDYAAGRLRDRSESTLERIMYLANVDRSGAVNLARALEEAGCGTFIVGRRGAKSRFVWDYSWISLGMAAAGEPVDKIDLVESPIEEPSVEGPDVPVDGATASNDGLRADGERNISITEAKRLLADSLGIPVASIEIIIRS